MIHPQSHVRIFFKNTDSYLDALFSEYEKLRDGMANQTTSLEVATFGDDMIVVDCTNIAAVHQTTPEGMRTFWEEQDAWAEFRKEIQPKRYDNESN